MKHTLLAAAATAALMVMPSVASAQDAGWYVRGNVGLGAFSDSDLETGTALSGELEAESDGTGSIGLGYDFDNNWRLELDGASLWNELGAINSTSGSSNDLRANSLMLNGLYDFDGYGKWAPYIGAGIGLVNSSISSQIDAGALGATVCTAGCASRDDDTTFGWQILTGLGYEISNNLSWDTQYRYLNAGSPDLDFIDSAVPERFTAALEDVASHSLMTGFRYKFGVAPAPAPVAAPAPAPVTYTQPVQTYTCWDGNIVTDVNGCAREPMPAPTYSCWDNSVVYDLATCPAVPAPTVEQRLCGQEYISQIVYYEFNKPLSAETRGQMQNILNISDVCQVSTVNLVGHTDTVGSAAYNVRLSNRRAEGVKSELVTLGVPAETIFTDGKGETELFVPTADNVKEQLNRRVEVSIRLDSVVPSY